MDFKVGDRVVLVDSSDYGIVAGGKGVVLSALDKNCQTIKVHMDKTGSSWFYPGRFKLEESKSMREDYTLTVASPKFIDFQRIYKETIVNGTYVARVKISGHSGSILMVDRKILKQGLFRVNGKALVQDLMDIGVYYGAEGGAIHMLEDKEWGNAYTLVKSLMLSPVLPEFKQEVTVSVEPIKVGGLV